MQGPPPFQPPPYNPGQFPNEPGFAPPPESPWPKILKVCGINLGILMLYSAGVYFVTSDDGGHMRGLGYMIIMMFFVGGHALINLILMIVFFVRKSKAYGLAFLVSLLLIGILGFGACMGGGTMLG